ncbi:class I SAM-dependent methyltransferase [Ruegeria sp. 2205SS24-7]|uniref:class I SAM-dependent methyltransferase n=1 Tax=Ruegeria discodermiae TaxID=3064389 RepID=UPI002741B07A|nr:class I SAM-dependent methyltransferase [Ruegeria sp. 2205SS24-7]MDP5215877.1 class I SAM-dependent methyltransferase [Ruegeria sp. 2205SS24-7]
MAYFNHNTEAYLNTEVRAADQHDRDLFATHTLMETIGDPNGKTVIDLCCGDGRLGWKLLEMGAKSVIGVDISREMLKRAGDQRKVLPLHMRERIRFVQADLRKSTLKLPQADIVTGLYVLHYADSPEAISGMGRFIARHMKPNATCAMVTLNPDIDPNADHSAAQAEEGVHITFSDGPESHMRIGEFSCPIWRWTRDVLEPNLTDAGLQSFDWQACDLPYSRPDLRTRYAEWLRNPQCVVFSARPAPVA